MKCEEEKVRDEVSGVKEDLRLGCSKEEEVWEEDKMEEEV